MTDLKLPIYLDYAATCPVDKRVADKMYQYMTNEGTYGNPASRNHPFGWEAEAAVEEARQHIATFLNADPREIIFTSGATEADNLAIKGSALFNKSKGKHIITCKTEHKAVLDSCRQLERDGFEVTYLTPETDGLIDIKKLEDKIRPDTILVTIMYVNNEVGVIQNISEIGALCRSKKITFHTDATQAPGKVDMDVKKLNADLISLSAHKVYGPKGIGALYISRKPRTRLEALIHGGGHERGFRSGTLPVHQIVGMGEAYRILHNEWKEELAKLTKLRDRLLNGLSHIEETHINGSMEHRIGTNLNISFNYVEGESLMMALRDIAVSSGSACTSASLEPSYVLRALGLNDELAHSSIRFSIGRYTTEAEIDYTISIMEKAVIKLRDLSPLWEFYKKGIDISTIQWAEH